MASITGEYTSAKLAVPKSLSGPCTALIEVVAIVAKCSPVSVREGNLDLREEHLLDRRAHTLRHIGSICQLVQTSLTLRLSSTAAQRLHAALRPCLGYGL